MTIHFNRRPPLSTTSSLTVAGFGFRTIGRLVSTIHFNQLSSINSVQSTSSSLTVAGFGFRTIGRLV
jgi:hypothetical protein